MRSDRGDIDEMTAFASHETWKERGNTIENTMDVHINHAAPFVCFQIDPGGEALAVLCKGTGLKRHYLMRLWAALKRPTEIGPGVLHPHYERIREIYEMMSVAKAQTTLRYWNWSLSTSFRENPNDALSADEEASREYSSSRRTARLVFGARGKD